MAGNKTTLIIVTAIGSRDRPGIVAALTRAIYDAGGNLDDATMTRLHGAFATMIAARVDDDNLPGLRERLQSLAPDLGLHISVEPIEERAQEEIVKDCPDHIISVYGADSPGIVHHVAAMLERSEVNITDLETRLTGAGTKPIYVMMIETSGGDWESLPHALTEIARSLGVDVSFSAIDEETL